MANEESYVWRPTFALRFVALAFTALAAGLGAWIILVAAHEGAVLQGIGFVVGAFWLPAATGLRYTLRARIEVTPTEVVVVTTFSERRFAWTEIADAAPGYSGISLMLKDGSTFLAGAVQKGNWSTWRARRTRSDDLVDLIRARSAAAGG